MSRRIVVAIDGPAGAGKSTLARRIAARLGYLYIDTGAMYRSVALWALRNGTPPEDVPALSQLAENAVIELANGEVRLNGEDVSADIREPEVSALASRIAAVGAVRRALVAKQRQYRDRHSVVMEGRDIGTVVFPEAQIKIYLDASAEERASRRGRDSAEDARSIAERDARDRSRPESPLVQAPDAVYLDSTGKSIEEVEELILQLVRAKTANGRAVEE
jgi:cytidylate kinase